MDDQRFDALTRALASGSSRRTAIKGLFVGLIGGAALTTQHARAGVQMECFDSSDCDPCQECDAGECNYPVSYPNGICCGTEGNYYCSPQCCSADNCEPIYDDQCGIAICNGSGYCEGLTTCATDQQCCNSGTPDHYCGVCCADTECPGCSVCVNGTCSDLECCGDSDCTSVCGECVAGACITRCTTGEYCCAFANDCRADGECCTDDECPCGGACIGGICYPKPPCPEGEECCGDQCVPSDECVHLCLPEGDLCDGEQLECCVGLRCCGFNGGSTCLECCDNDDCPDCSVCSNGTCLGQCNQSQECCDDKCVPNGTCCGESGDTCSVTDGPGTQGTCCDDLLCCATGEGGECAECCSDNDCGPCGYCSLGVCYGECSQSQECCDRECVDIGTCCQDEVGGYCTFGDPDPGDETVVCCSGLLCCETEHSAACLECCDTSDCGPCAYCSEGVCYGECSQSESCCNGQCVDDDTCCHPQGTTCGVVPTDDTAQLDCCDGLFCCDNFYGASVCAECCVDTDCPRGEICLIGICGPPLFCETNHDCAYGSGCCCKDTGMCEERCCQGPHPPKPPKPPKPAPSGDTPSTLPATGAGPNDERNSLFGVTAFGAAAALYAAKKLRETPDPTEN